MKIKRLIVLFLLACPCLLTSCKNIFSDDKIQLDRRIINGTVKLSQESDLQNIYVYLDGLDIGTFTDKNGKFSISLPPNLGSSTEGMTSGVFNLYFYLANFELKSAKVAVKDGNFIFGQAALDKNGYVMPSPFLSRSLTIESWVTSGYKGSPNIYMVRTRMTAYKDGFPVDLPNASQELLGGALIKNITTGAVHSEITFTAGYLRVYHFLANSTGKDFFLLFDSNSLLLEPGNYLVIPHILPNYDVIAQKIAASMGIDPALLTADYLKWPMRFTGGSVTIPEDQKPD